MRCNSPLRHLAGHQGLNSRHNCVLSFDGLNSLQSRQCTPFCMSLRGCGRVALLLASLHVTNLRSGRRDHFLHAPRLPELVLVYGPTAPPQAAHDKDHRPARTFHHFRVHSVRIPPRSRTPLKLLLSLGGERACGVVQLADRTDTTHTADGIAYVVFCSVESTYEGAVTWNRCANTCVRTVILVHVTRTRQGRSRYELGGDEALVKWIWTSV